MSTSGRARYAFARGSAALALPNAVPVWLAHAAAAAASARGPITIHAVPGSTLPHDRRAPTETSCSPRPAISNPVARADDEGRFALLLAAPAVTRPLTASGHSAATTSVPPACPSLRSSGSVKARHYQAIINRL